MPGHAERVPNLATLLNRYKEEIAAAWAETVHRLPRSHYRERPLEELRASTMRGLGAIIEALSSGSYTALEAYLTDVSFTRLDMGFDIAEVIEALLLFENVALPVIWRAYPPGSAAAQEAAVLINGCLRRMIAYFANLYTSSVSRRLRDLEALYRADEEVSRSLELDEVLNALVRVAVEALGADKSSLMVWDAQRERLVVRAARGFSPETMAQMSFALGEGIVGRVAASGELMVVEDALTDPRVAKRVTEPEGIRSFMHVPIKIGGQVFGVFNVNYARPRAFSVDDQRLFLALAQRAALAIENARLYEQAQQVATSEERQRLARELHDSVTQALYSVTLYAEAAARLLTAGNADAAADHLQELRDTAQEALQEARRLIFELHPPALEKKGLVAALQARLEAVEGRAGLETEFKVEGEGRLPLETEEGLYRIAQEALNNALKHARARKITVHLRQDGQRVTLEVADDGVGFDPETAAGEGMGLASMAERAQLMGGELEIESELGEGTRVRINIGMRGDS